MSYIVERGKPHAVNIFDRNKSELNQFSNFEDLFLNLNEEDQENLSYLSAMYEWSCEPQNRKASSEEGWIRDDFRLISTIAIIEKLMESEDYQPFHVWLEERITTLPSKGTKKAYQNLFKEYNKKFGLSHKVKNSLLSI